MRHGHRANKASTTDPLGRIGDTVKARENLARAQARVEADRSGLQLVAQKRRQLVSVAADQGPAGHGYLAGAEMAGDGGRADEADPQPPGPGSRKDSLKRIDKDTATEYG